MLALKLLVRDWRSGQLGLICAALVLAVAVVTSVGLLADRVEKALVAESSSFLAADRVIHSGRAIDPTWQEMAAEYNIESAQTAIFPSMIFHGDVTHLAAVKAVENRYPLRGALKISTVPFTTDPDRIEQVRHGPESGEAWVDARVLPLLNIQLGDAIEVGEVKLKVTRVLIEEPDRGDSFSLFGARVLMNWDDLEAAGVIQPGSRVRYRLLLAGSDRQLDEFLGWLQSRLTVHHTLLTPDQAQAGITDALDKGRKFLLLAGSAGVVLAGIALALASRRYADSQGMSVALMKSWGVSARRVRWLYWQQILWLALLGAISGLLLGAMLQNILIALVREWLPVVLPAAGWRPWLTGLLTGGICLLGFALPAIWHLPLESPLRVIRREVVGSPVNNGVKLLIGVLAIMLLLLGYSQDLTLATILLVSFAVTALTCMGLGYQLLKIALLVGQKMGSQWRLALANLWRRRLQSLVQLVGFSSAIMLLLLMLVIRTSLIEEWRWQLAEDAPNHFLINVAPYQLDEVNKILQKNHLASAGWYSMVRGRLTHINGNPPSQLLKEQHESLNRELNLSWSATLPADNRIVDGVWWENATADEGITPVSIEANLASELGLALGDRLTFSIGGLPVEAVVTSTRDLQWDNMTPNFYFLFPENSLQEFPRIYMTSLYIPKTQKLVLNELLQQFPTIQVIELDVIIHRIQQIISQVTSGLEMMTLMILACGVLVLFAAVSLSMTERLQESAILRTMGSPRRLILGVQLIEFAALGLAAGLLAVIGAETALWLLHSRIFQLPVRLHPWLWLAGPLSGAMLVGSLGLLYSRRVVVQPPLRVLTSIG